MNISIGQIKFKAQKIIIKSTTGYTQDLTLIDLELLLCVESFHNSPFHFSHNVSMNIVQQLYYAIVAILFSIGLSPKWNMKKSTPFESWYFYFLNVIVKTVNGMTRLNFLLMICYSIERFIVMGMHWIGMHWICIAYSCGFWETLTVSIEEIF